MLGWSLPVGKVFGVEVRLHWLFVVLLLLSMMWASVLGRPMSRGVALWGIVLASVVVRECARAIAAAWFSVELRSVLLLPTGGILSFGSAESVRRIGEPKVQRAMALVGPLASFVFGLVMAGMVLTVSPGVNLVGFRWVSPVHLLRALVWVNVILAAVNLLPAWPLDAGRVVQGEIMRSRAAGEGLSGERGTAGFDAMKAFARLGPAIALGLICFGIVSTNWWAIVIGLGVLLGAQVERSGAVMATDADTVKVKDVMLTEYSILSASATLEDAVEQARHTLQDVFPVVRAGNMVGTVGRQEILQALQASGNGYVQGIMARSFEAAEPDDSLVAALGRVTGKPGVSSTLVPVVVGERIVGILTPQNLQRSMGLLIRSANVRALRAEEDESE